MTIREILKHYWGYDSFRPLQEEIILSVIDGKDTLALMPTGGGKSITYQVPALFLEGTCIVITPLIALMKDQVEDLLRRGIPAGAIYTGMEREDVESTVNKALARRLKFLYVSPERLVSAYFRERLKQMQVSLLAVDEAHCISQWGYDFRPSYLRIAEIREFFPAVPVLALTATATPKVAEDIQCQLHFARPHVLSKSFRRENLSYVVRKANDKLGETLHILSNLPSSAIVYVRKRVTAEELAAFLNAKGIRAAYYHAGLPPLQRAMRQEAWKKGECPVMVATNAFGMGIDKPDVRIVLHFDIPDSPEAYFQEAGRAGRDGKRAYAVLLYNEAALTACKKRVEKRFPDIKYVLINDHLTQEQHDAFYDCLRNEKYVDALIRMAKELHEHEIIRAKSRESMGSADFLHNRSMTEVAASRLSALCDMQNTYAQARLIDLKRGEETVRGTLLRVPEGNYCANFATLFQQSRRPDGRELSYSPHALAQMSTIRVIDLLLGIPTRALEDYQVQYVLHNGTYRIENVVAIQHRSIGVSPLTANPLDSFGEPDINLPGVMLQNVASMIEQLDDDTLQYLLGDLFDANQTFSIRKRLHRMQKMLKQQGDKIKRVDIEQWNDHLKRQAATDTLPEPVQEWLETVASHIITFDNEI